MAETVLILLAGGVMLAVAIEDPRQVTLNWLRLGGMIALSLAGVGLYFQYADARDLAAPLKWDERKLFGFTIALVLAHLAFVQTDRRTLQRWIAAGAFISSVLAAMLVTHHAIVMKSEPPGLWSLRAAALLGIAATSGLALMDMLLGHAYLTAAKMTIKPFHRLNLSLGAALGFRLLLAAGACLLVNYAQSGNMFWSQWGLYIGTRFLVGLIVPAIFVYMAHDCIRRRATQSATGILYVAGVLIFIGEIVGLYLVRETRLPF